VIYVEKRLALAIMFHTQSARLAVAGIQTFKKFVPSLMVNQSAKMFALHALRLEKLFAN
jgi:hypothetical protein